MYAILKDGFTFVATESIPQERIKLGYQEMKENHPFLLETHSNPKANELAMNLAMTSDFVIFGSAPKSFIKERIKQNKATYIYSERIFKNPKGKIDWRWLYYVYIYHVIYKNRISILSASYYLPNDLKAIHAQPKQIIRWGYFPEFIPYSVDQIVEMKSNDVPVITWVGRLIDWKHPEQCLYLADRLRTEGIDFKLRIIGTGPLETDLKNRSKSLNLEHYVEFMGSIDYRSVRKELARSNIFIFTSDFNEGWGAVLNEAMNAACAVVVNDAIGSAPILVHHQENGYLYSNNDNESFYNHVKTLILDPQLSRKIGISAYEFIQDHYNSSIACQNLIKLLSGNPTHSDVEPGCPEQFSDIML